MSKKSILMLIGDYVEDYEVMVLLKPFKWSATPSTPFVPAKIRRVRPHLHSRFRGDQTYTEKRGHNFALNATFDTVKPEAYDALMIPGGRSPNIFASIRKSSRSSSSSQRLINPSPHLPRSASSRRRGSSEREKMQRLPRHRPTSLSPEANMSPSHDRSRRRRQPRHRPRLARLHSWLAKFLTVLGTKIEA